MVSQYFYTGYCPDNIDESCCKQPEPEIVPNWCVCDIMDLMARGCTCGQMQREREENVKTI